MGDEDRVAGIGAVRVGPPYGERYGGQLRDGCDKLHRSGTRINDAIVIDRGDVECLAVLADTDAADVTKRRERHDGIRTRDEPSGTQIPQAIGGIPARLFLDIQGISNGPDILLDRAVLIHTAPEQMHEILVLGLARRCEPQLGVGRRVRVDQIGCNSCGRHTPSPEGKGVAEGRPASLSCETSPGLCAGAQVQVCGGGCFCRCLSTGEVGSPCDPRTRNRVDSGAGFTNQK